MYIPVQCRRKPIVDAVRMSCQRDCQFCVFRTVLADCDQFRI
jgi:hypothetical protein